MDGSNPLIHLVAGAVGGTVGAVVTSPLDVVKTRLQSSGATWTPRASGIRTLTCPHSGLPIDPTRALFVTQPLHVNNYSTATPASQIPRLSLLQCLRHIYRTEGLAGWFRGLGPNLVGVAPSRAIYFCTYAKSKELYSRSPLITSHGNSTTMVHLLSAATGGFICCTLTNPLWFLKTRLQLDSKAGVSKLTVLKCIRDVYKENGIRGFYRGLSASYLGTSDTILNFVIYEKLKELLVVHGHTVDMENDRSPLVFAEYMIAGGISKTIACVTFYPHEVLRTRMREECNMHRGLVPTLTNVLVEDGWQGLYRGLAAHLLRAIPNTAIMLCTYELAVYAMTSNTKTDNSLAEEQK